MIGRCNFEYISIVQKKIAHGWKVRQYCTKIVQGEIIHTRGVQKLENIQDRGVESYKGLYKKGGGGVQDRVRVKKYAMLRKACTIRIRNASLRKRQGTRQDRTRQDYTKTEENTELHNLVQKREIPQSCTKAEAHTNYHRDGKLYKLAQRRKEEPAKFRAGMRIK